MFTAWGAEASATATSPITVRISVKKRRPRSTSFFCFFKLNFLTSNRRQPKPEYGKNDSRQPSPGYNLRLLPAYRQKRVVYRCEWKYRPFKYLPAKNLD